ncbi:hypothetical protein [uncultured Lacinutrix sp.]|uniref:hypothetical protein n=1 Tax=uncultured Lacinutrix sp. TaxID=574032 RepID=UPI002605A103|nr:hypothetical protein [uncultured Lacinutrix sp.]
MFKKTIAIQDTTLDKSLETAGREPMLPRGSALITTSGNLYSKGMKAIINAATGAMTKSGGIFEPTETSIANSIKNSFTLMSVNGYNKIAVPFIGGKIFISRIGVTANALAKCIIDACFKANSDGSQFVLVIHGTHDYNIFKQEINTNYPAINYSKVLKEGSILDFSLHQCDTIMNAANMEVKFGGGLSGIIANATGEQVKIDAEALAAIKQFWKAQ